MLLKQYSRQRKQSVKDSIGFLQVPRRLRVRFPLGSQLRGVPAQLLRGSISVDEERYFPLISYVQPQL